MVKRIVKLTFKPEKVESFMTIFEKNWQFIRYFEGCTHLELLQDKHNASIFFTYSMWKNEDFLEKYRQSQLFAEVWGETKLLFQQAPEAWTVKDVGFDDAKDKLPG
jgi:quinol monooxygenase YgiN